MRFKIGDNVDHIMHGANFIIVATKEEPRKRENSPDLKVPKGFDYYIVSNRSGNPEEIRPFMSCHESHLEERTQ